MYQIIKDGETIALTDNPTYIRLADNGCYVGAAETTAQGVAVNGTPYNLFGKRAMPGLETVIVRRVDGGDIMTTQETAQANTESFVYADQYMHWDGIKWIFSPDNPIPLLRLPFTHGMPNAFYRYIDGKRYVYVSPKAGEITEDNFNDVMELWDIEE